MAEELCRQRGGWWQLRQYVGHRASHMCRHISHTALQVSAFYWRQEFARMSRLSSALLKKCHAVCNPQRLVTGGQQAQPHQVSPVLCAPCGGTEAGLHFSTCPFLSIIKSHFLFLCARLLSFCLHPHAFHLSFCLAILPHKFTYLFFPDFGWASLSLCWVLCEGSC